MIRVKQTLARWLSCDGIIITIHILLKAEKSQLRFHY
jgi:hypothetical protein